MSTLTKNERDGLEEVFLSIQTNKQRYEKMKEISSLIVSRSNSFNMLKLLIQAKNSLKETKISHFVDYLSKKKKKLSK
jgi:phosphoribosyl-AMP cyclohydrolase